MDRVYVIQNGSVRLLLGGSRTLSVSIVDGYRALSASLDASSTREFFEALAELVSERPELLLESRRAGCDYYGCSTLLAPDTALIAKLLQALAGVLRRAPEPKLAVDDNGVEYWAWSPEESKAAAKAVILLDLAAMILRKPEMVEKLPGDTSLLQLLDSLQQGDGSSEAKPQPEAHVEKEAAVEG